MWPLQENFFCLFHKCNNDNRKLHILVQNEDVIGSWKYFVISLSKMIFIDGINTEQAAFDNHFILQVLYPLIQPIIRLAIEK